MKYIFILALLPACVSAYAAQDKPATDGAVQAVNAGVKQVEAELQAVNSNVQTLNSAVRGLANETRNYYGGLEYVLLAIAQAFYFGLGVALFYVFDRGRVARDIW